MSPTNAPEFIRLADHMVHGLVVDMETGWSISGYDVQEFPEAREQARFVKRQINAGIIEPATQAEFDEAHPESEESEEERDAERMVRLVQAAQGRGGTQEHVLRERESRGAASLQRARAKAKAEEEGYDVDDADDIDYAVDKQRREAIIAEQEEDGLTDDDVEAQKERTATRPAVRAKKAAKATKKSGGRRKAEESAPSE
jgi:hypothetical protein